jgi:hypothetical protein
MEHLHEPQTDRDMVEKHNVLADWIQFFKSVGIDLFMYLAGVAGAIVSLPKQKAFTLIEKSFVILSGGLVSMYLAPVFADWMHAGTNTRYGLGFIVGYLGLKSVEMAIDWLKSRKNGNS